MTGSSRKSDSEQMYWIITLSLYQSLPRISVDERLVTPETRRGVEELIAEIEADRMSYEDALERAQNVYHLIKDWRMASERPGIT